MKAVNLIVRHVKPRCLQLRLNRNIIRKIQLQEYLDSVFMKCLHHLPEFNLRGVRKGIGALRSKITPFSEIPVVLLPRLLRCVCGDLLGDAACLFPVTCAHAIRLSDNLSKSLGAKLINRHQLHSVYAKLFQIQSLVCQTAEGSLRRRM